MRNQATLAAGQSIRTVRQLAGLTLEEAAAVTGRSPGYLSLVETGKAANVTEKYIANTIGQLCEFIANPTARVQKAGESDGTRRDAA